MPKRFVTVAQVKDLAVARILLVALRAHGFHPLDPSDGGLPGVPNLFGPDGVPVDVPEDEAEDAQILVADLLREMEGSHS